MTQTTKKEFSKDVIIYSSHKLRNDRISITYANVLKRGETISTQKTIEIDKIGGALNSLYLHCCPQSY